MATALDNLATVTAADRNTLDSITAALASSNAEIASLKRKLKSKNISTETNSSVGITSGHTFFAVGRSTPVHPASGQK